MSSERPQCPPVASSCSSNHNQTPPKQDSEHQFFERDHIVGERVVGILKELFESFRQTPQNTH